MWFLPIERVKCDWRHVKKHAQLMLFNVFGHVGKLASRGLASSAICAVGLNVSADTVISSNFTQNGGTYFITPPTLHVTHDTNNPLLTLTGGASTSNVQATVIGTFSGHEGQLLIDGGSGLSNIGDGSYIAGNVQRGAGNLGLNAGSIGIATIRGTNSRWSNSHTFNVGLYGVGTLNVEAGGLISDGSGQIGTYAGSSGVATISGGDSRWNNSLRLDVGVFGAGTLNVNAGGKIVSQAGSIGYSSVANNVATIAGTGSSWTTSGDLYVGESGRGTLFIEAGGQVDNFWGRMYRGECKRPGYGSSFRDWLAVENFKPLCRRVRQRQHDR